VAKLDCPGELCDAEQGACLPCVPGEPLGCFDEFTRIVCSKQGTADQMEPCTTEEPYCDPQGKGVCRACTKDEHCKHLPDEGWCSKPVCEGFTCKIGVDVGKPYPEFEDAGDCGKTICVADENGNPKLGLLPDPSDTGTDNPDDCVTKYCDGITLIAEKSPVGAACKTDDKAGKCDDKAICQECFAGEIACVGNALGTCDVSGGKNQLLTASCASLSKGATPACDGAACVGVTSVALGEQHTCALLANQRVECWGDNKHGQSAAPKELLKTPQPTLVPGLSGVLQLALGSRHSCALLAGGTVHCWGDNSRGQLGVTSIGSSPTPIPVEGLSGVTFLAAGGKTTCALTSDKKMLCWGDGEHGQTFVSAGAAQFLSKPTEVPGAPTFSRIALGRRHGCGLTEEGLVHCWGDPTYTGGATPANTKVNLSGTYEELDVGALHSCARGPGGFYCWGEPGAKLGSTFPQGQFTVVGLLAAAGQGLSLGTNTTCQLVQEGGVSMVQCVGLNDRGQLGGPIQDSMNPFVNALPGASKLVVGGDHACAFAPWDPAKPKDGVPALHCWGANDSGQVGTGHFEDVKTPQKVIW
jgi:alpha-tubulin suppressor-like RCC1 family protein